MDVCTGVGTGIGTKSIPIPDSSVSWVEQPGSGYFGEIGTTLTRYHQIVTSKES